MKKLIFLFVALCATVLTSCSKKEQDEIKPVLSGVYQLTNVAYPSGMQLNVPDLYIKFDSDGTFKEITVFREDDKVLYNGYQTGEYSYQNNMLVFTKGAINNNVISANVIVVGDNNVQINTRAANISVINYTFKKSTENIELLIEDYFSRLD